MRTLAATATMAITLLFGGTASAGDAPQSNAPAIAPAASAECPTGMSALFLGMAPMLQANCELLMPSYAGQTREDFAAWQRIWSRCLGPHFDKDMASYRLQAANQNAMLTEEQKQAKLEVCQANIFDLATSVRPPRPQYATPEATWTEFHAALLARDKPRALMCLTSASNQTGKTMSRMSLDDLEKFGNSLTAIRRTANADANFVEASTEQAPADNGKARDFHVRFANVNGNWLIESL